MYRINAGSAVFLALKKSRKLKALPWRFEGEFFVKFFKKSRRKDIRKETTLLQVLICLKKILCFPKIDFYECNVRIAIVFYYQVFFLRSSLDNLITTSPYSTTVARYWGLHRK